MYIFKKFPVACPRTPPPLEHFLFLNQLQISSAEKNEQETNVENMPSPLLTFFATPLPTLVVEKKIWSLVSGPTPQVRNASVIVAKGGDTPLPRSLRLDTPLPRNLRLGACERIISLFK